MENEIVWNPYIVAACVDIYGLKLDDVRRLLELVRQAGFNAVAFRILWNKIDFKNMKLDRVTEEALLEAGKRGFLVVCKSGSFNSDDQPLGGYPLELLLKGSIVGIPIEKFVGIEANLHGLIFSLVSAAIGDHSKIKLYNINSDSMTENDLYVKMLAEKVLLRGKIPQTAMSVSIKDPSLIEAEIPVAVKIEDFDDYWSFLSSLLKAIKTSSKPLIALRFDLNSLEEKNIQPYLATLMGLGIPVIIQPFNECVRDTFSIDSRERYVRGERGLVSLFMRRNSKYYKIRTLLLSVNTFLKYHSKIRVKRPKRLLLKIPFLKLKGGILTFKWVSEGANLIFIVNPTSETRMFKHKVGGLRIPVKGEIVIPPYRAMAIPVNMRIEEDIVVKYSTAPITHIYNLNDKIMIVCFSLSASSKERMCLRVGRQEFLLEFKGDGRSIYSTCGHGKRIQVICFSEKEVKNFWDVRGAPMISNADLIYCSNDDIVVESGREKVWLKTPLQEGVKKTKIFSKTVSSCTSTIDVENNFLGYQVNFKHYGKYSIRLEEWYYRGDSNEFDPYYNDSLWNNVIVAEEEYKSGFKWYRARIPLRKRYDQLVYGLSGIGLMSINGVIVDSCIGKEFFNAEIRHVKLGRLVDGDELYVTALTYSPGNRTKPPFSKIGITTPLVLSKRIIYPQTWAAAFTHRLQDSPPTGEWVTIRLSKPAIPRSYRKRKTLMSWYRAYVDIPSIRKREVWLFVERPGDAKIWFNNRLVMDSRNQYNPVGINVTEITRVNELNELYIGIINRAGVKSPGRVEVVIGEGIKQVKYRRLLRGEREEWYKVGKTLLDYWKNIRVPFIQEDYVGWYTTFFNLDIPDETLIESTIDLTSVRGLFTVYVNGHPLGTFSKGVKLNVPSNILRKGENNITLVLLGMKEKAGLLGPVIFDIVGTRKIFRLQFEK